MPWAWLAMGDLRSHNSDHHRRLPQASEPLFLPKALRDELSDAQSLRVYVSQLRQKIESAPERPQVAQDRASRALLKPII
jgi:hypothetical protein